MVFFLGSTTCSNRNRAQEGWRHASLGKGGLCKVSQNDPRLSQVQAHLDSLLFPQGDFSAESSCDGVGVGPLAVKVPVPADKNVCQLQRRGCPLACPPFFSPYLLDHSCPDSSPPPLSSPTKGFFQAPPLLTAICLSLSSSILMVSLTPPCR